MLVDRRAALDRGARAELDLPGQPRVAAGNVGRVRDVDHDRNVGLERKRCRPSTEEPHFLGDGRHCNDVHLRIAGLGNPVCRLERNVRAEPVVERPRDDPAVTELERLAVPDTRVAGPNELVGFLAVPGTDVDVQVCMLETRPVAAAASGALLHAAAPDDAAHLAVSTRDPDSLSHQHLGGEATDRCERQEPVLADRRHCKADLVDVADERRASARPPPSEHGRTTCRACRRAPPRTPKPHRARCAPQALRDPRGRQPSEAREGGRESASACGFKQQRLRWGAK